MLLVKLLKWTIKGDKKKPLPFSISPQSVKLLYSAEKRNYLFDSLIYLFGELFVLLAYKLTEQSTVIMLVIISLSIFSY